MSNDKTNIEAAPKRTVRRKPMTLMVPAGERIVERADGLNEIEKLYTMETFTSIVDLRENLEARELDQTNANGIILFRADPIEVRAMMKSQVVIKFGAEKE